MDSMNSVSASTKRSGASQWTQCPTPLDDLKPASRDCRVRCMGVLDGDDAIFRTPDDERRHPGGQVELIGRAHRLTTRVDDGAQRAQEGATRVDVPERSVAPPELGNHGRVLELLAENDAPDRFDDPPDGRCAGHE